MLLRRKRAKFGLYGVFGSDVLPCNVGIAIPRLDFSCRVYRRPVNFAAKRLTAGRDLAACAGSSRQRRGTRPCIRCPISRLEGEANQAPDHGPQRPQSRRSRSYLLEKRACLRKEPRTRSPSIPMRPRTPAVCRLHPATPWPQRTKSGRSAFSIRRDPRSCRSLHHIVLPAHGCSTLYRWCGLAEGCRRNVGSGGHAGDVRGILRSCPMVRTHWGVPGS